MKGAYPGAAGRHAPMVCSTVSPPNPAATEKAANQIHCALSL